MTILLRFFRAIRALLVSTVVLSWLCIALASLSITSAGIAWHLSLEVVSLTAKAAATAVAHRKEITTAVFKTKAKGRLRRYVVAVPIVGTAAAVAFEEFEYREWKKENPEGGRIEFGCQVWESTVEVLDEVLQELPEITRPSSETVSKWLPKCKSDASASD